MSFLQLQICFTYHIHIVFKKRVEKNWTEGVLDGVGMFESDWALQYNLWFLIDSVGSFRITCIVHPFLLFLGL